MVKIDTSSSGLEIFDCGITDYSSSVALQKKLKNAVQNREIGGAILLLEYGNPVITLGRRGNEETILYGSSVLNENNIEVFKVTRGGDVTAHEPGQVVVYIVAPVEPKKSLAFVEKALEPVITCLREDYFLDVYSLMNQPGIWVSDRKIASAGFDLTGGVSTHGIALNVNNSLSTFNYIIPCGMVGVQMTSLSRERSEEINLQCLKEDLAFRFTVF